MGNWFPQKPKYYNKSIEENPPHKTEGSLPYLPPQVLKGPRHGNLSADNRKSVTWDQCLQNDGQGHKEDKVRAGYYGRAYRVKHSLDSKDAENRSTIKILSAELGGEWSRE